MNPNTFPTKGNLILAKNSLALASQGYELMDKKRNILIRELMALIDQAERHPVGNRCHLPDRLSGAPEGKYRAGHQLCPGGR